MFAARFENAWGEAERVRRVSGGHVPGDLERHIIKLSVAKTWPQARLEWRFTTVRDGQEEENFCPCGQSIRYLCEIVNLKNRKVVSDVGNVCIHKFLGDALPTKLVNAFIRLKGNRNASFCDRDILRYLYKHEVISRRDARFLDSLGRKRNLSPKQQKWKDDLVNKALAFFERPVKQFDFG